MQRLLGRLTWVTTVVAFTAGVVVIAWGLGCPCNNLGQEIALIYLGFLIWLVGAALVAIGLVLQVLSLGRSD